MIAADLIAAAAIDVDTLAAALPRVDPARVPVRVAPRWFRAVWGPGISAVAMPWAVYLHPRHLDRPPGDLGRLIVHELTHVDQWRRLGFLRWARAYLGDYLRGRRRGMSHEESYRYIALEVEARAVSRRIEGLGG